MSARAPSPTGEARFTRGPSRWRAPVRRHRPGSRSGPATWAGRVLLLVAVLVAGGLIADTRLTVEEKLRAFVVHGGPGEQVSARNFELTVLDVSAAAEIRDEFGRRFDTGGVWLLVQVQVVADRAPVELGVAELRDPDDRVWVATDRVSQPLVDRRYPLQPGVPIVGVIVFEVPRSLAADMVLRVGEDPLQSFPTVAEVPLPAPVVRDTDAPGAEDPQPVPVPPAEVVW